MPPKVCGTKILRIITFCCSGGTGYSLKCPAGAAGAGLLAALPSQGSNIGTGKIVWSLQDKIAFPHLKLIYFACN